MSNRPLHKQIDGIDKAITKMSVKRNILLEKSMGSEDPNDIIKASNVIHQLQAKEQSNRKSIVLDPYAFASSFGYKDKPVQMSFDMLKHMSKTPIIKAIHTTRISQIANFSVPQKDKYSIGYQIRKRRLPGLSDPDKVTYQEEKEIYELYNFIENCGDEYSYDSNRDFESFLRKVVKDSLRYDQMPFEIIYNRAGRPHSFYAVDGATVRIAESYDDDQYESHKKMMYHYGYGSNGMMSGAINFEDIKGYYPSYVQVFDNKVHAVFYPWEMCFGVRNPVTDVNMYGYGVSELEEMITLITSMLWAEEYNRRFFKQGSVPKGLLKVSGNIGEAKLNELKQQWTAQMRGVWNAWRTPVVEADKVDWVDLQKSNRDMEWSGYLEFLIKIACAVYLIDPSEINFPMSSGLGSSQAAIKFEGSNEQRIKHSKDKGLYPILRFLQRKINRFLIIPKNPKYELVFAGLDALTPQEELEMDVKSVTNFDTLNEVRKRRGGVELKNGDVPLNPAYIQYVLQQAQLAQMEGVVEGTEGSAEFLEEGEGEETEKAENPFEKALTSYLKTLN